MDELCSKKPADTTTVKVWSDDPSNQFKNKYVMSSLDKLSRKHKVHMIWNFCATSHGKDPVDRAGFPKYYVFMGGGDCEQNMRGDK